MGTAAYSDVIEGCIKGERKAQKLLYEHLAPKMFSVCLRYMGERKAAEDVLQDAFVTLFSKIDSFSDTGSFDGWARRIFVNTALMSLRKKDALKMSDDLDSAWNVSSDMPSQVQDLRYK